MWRVTLSDSERAELRRLRDSGDKPYLRERAAAILKVAEGQVAVQVAARGLLRPRRPRTVHLWLKRYRDEGTPGLSIRPGRGRRASFSP